MDNILLLTDSYKVSHWRQYPPGTTTVYSYFESRGGKYDEVCFFGLQYFLKRYLSGVVVTKEKIDEAEGYYDGHFPPGFSFNRKGWEHILNKHGGKLPLKIKAVPEGTVVPTKNVLMTVENTDPECFWLTNYVETLLVQVWHPMTVCTHSREQKKVIAKYLDVTGDPGGLGFKLHDFGFRGVSSVESAGTGAAAHLVNFMGTDTVAGLVVAKDYYGDEMAGFSIPASEHSTITAWGQAGEVNAMRNMLEQYPTGLVACVSDSFDVYKACSELWGGELKDAVLARDGTLVVRPDSGDPATTSLKCLKLLGAKFGAKTNDKGYKVLDDHVRVIWGDGIDLESLCTILATLKAHGWSADNIAFGSGGGLLQKLNRDTQKCAFKCSAITIDGEERVVFKDPVTDRGKVSKKGRLALVKERGVFVTRTSCGRGDVAGDVLQAVFEDGVVLVDQTFEDVRARAALPTADELPLLGSAGLQHYLMGLLGL
mmetsp:Transcript_2844/g.8596  ORF Transcript_2844/g.8596 Transcript_2844/m.8596 type:complete len:483 (-) Transcript_2844:41-1489(-)